AGGSSGGSVSFTCGRVGGDREGVATGRVMSPLAGDGGHRREPQDIATRREMTRTDYFFGGSPSMGTRAVGGGASGSASVRASSFLRPRRPSRAGWVYSRF